MCGASFRWLKIHQVQCKKRHRVKREVDEDEEDEAEEEEREKTPSPTESAGGGRRKRRAAKKYALYCCLIKLYPLKQSLI